MNVEYELPAVGQSTYIAHVSASSSWAGTRAPGMVVLFDGHLDLLALGGGAVMNCDWDLGVGLAYGGNRGDG